MSKHTPGPWEKWDNPDGRHEILYAGKDHSVYVSRIAKTYRHSNESGDADLITAAPDLLEACKATLHALGSMDEATSTSTGDPEDSEAYPGEDELIENRNRLRAQLRSAISNAEGGI